MPYYCPEIIQCPETHIAGLELHVASETSDSWRLQKEIWEDWISRMQAMGQQPLSGSGKRYGLTYNSAPGGQFTYLAGMEVRHYATMPAGMAEKIIPAGAYARFSHRGDWKQLHCLLFDIYNKWLPDSDYHLVPVWKCGHNHCEQYAADFNWEEFSPGVDILIPVRPK
ncbi:GyrI-like domain-containing protein [candidate division FCPU426 bacterium]|nr:GyrI-like domain-containing protein [candidate division FCPU426 bacterium]